jgi:MFS family permease
MLEARAIEVGCGKAEASLVVAATAAVVFVSALPLGRLDDARGPRTTFAVGMAALVLGNLTLLMSSTHPWAVFASTLFIGLHYAVIQGPMLSIVVGLAPPHLRGTAFGVFYTVMAFTAVGANTLYGSVWTAIGAPYVFALSAAMTACSLAALPWLLPAGSRVAASGRELAQRAAKAAVAAAEAAAELAAAAAAAVAPQHQQQDGEGGSGARLLPATASAA